LALSQLAWEEAKIRRSARIQQRWNREPLTFRDDRCVIAVTAVIALGIAALAVHEGREAWEGEEDDDD
jgi:hypothetical protein